MEAISKSTPPLRDATKPGRLLLVDDEESVLWSIQRLLRRGGWEIETALDGVQGLEVFRSFQPAVVVSDFHMPGMSGVEFLTRVKELAPRTQRILLTGLADQRALEDAINTSEIYRFIAKPWNDQQVLLNVQSAFDHWALQMENERLAALTREQNDELRALNHALEERVAQRTRLLETAKREWERTFDTIDTPLAVVSVGDYAVKRANRTYARVASRPVQELVSSPCYRYLFGRDAPCEHCPLQAAISEGAEKHAEVSHAGRTYELSVYPIMEESQAVCTYRDVTQEREIARRMLDTEKMAAVGQLAGGVAHEINNPLGGILAFSQLMKRDQGRSEQDVESLDLIEESALRCKRIVESLLRFARKSRDENRHRFDLSRCVDDAAYLFRAQLKGAPKAHLEMKLASGLPEVHGDPAHLGQVVLNLLQNALQALPEGVGTIAVETGQAGEEHCFFRVSDTGTGIAPEHLPHLFEPSFTTKPPGEGTGLGLAIAYRIVHDHGGEFQVETEVGRGSSFTVTFPVPLLSAAPHP